MSAEPMDPETRRVSDEVADRLRARGVDVTRDDSNEELVQLLEAVEQFERTVERSGGDLMVDEAIAGVSATDPDDRAFVLPSRRQQESVGAYLERIAEARDRAARRRG